jgi:Flp pilus assembly protein TadD
MNTEALKGQATLCALAGDLAEAQDHWIRAGEIHGYDGEILRGLAVLALRTDRHGSAMQYLQDALLVNPNDDEARGMLEELRRQSELRFAARSDEDSS